MPNSQNPYISIVTVSRNDNHGGDMLKRMRIFVRALLHQCNTFQLPCELVMVEWNPIEGEKLLHEILPSVTEPDFLSIRYVVVPNEIHRHLAFSDKIPLFQMIGKNVGIRRAKAKFVLCTNVDLLFSNELFKRLSKRNLQEHCFYRSNRCDIPNTIQEDWTVKEQLQFCKSNISLRNGKNADYANFADTTGFMFRYPVFLPLLKLLSTIKASYATSTLDRLNELDFDACGDFTLMSKQNWISMQGYPELEIYSIHIDSMGVIAAAALGFKQIIFKGEECTYHIEHKGGWEFKNPIDRIQFYTKFPMLEWWAVRQAGVYMLDNILKWNLNKEDWGFANREFQEFS
jgi:hypothetical protein